MWFVLYESYWFCIPSFIFMIEWICTNANNIHLNAASVKSSLFTKPAFETKLILPCYCQFYEFFGICVTQNPIFNGYFYREHRFYHFNIPFVRKLVVDFTDSKNRILIEQVWMPEINRSAEPNFDEWSLRSGPAEVLSASYRDLSRISQPVTWPYISVLTYTLYRYDRRLRRPKSELDTWSFNFVFVSELVHL